MAVITVTQIDIAFSGMIISELVSIGTVRHLLNGKTFYKDDLDEDIPDNKSNRSASATAKIEKLIEFDDDVPMIVIQ
jgi:hypothetical protein